MASNNGGRKRLDVAAGMVTVKDDINRLLDRLGVELLEIDISNGRIKRMKIRREETI